MKRFILLLLAVISAPVSSSAQTSAAVGSAVESIQQSKLDPDAHPQRQAQEAKLTAGTVIEVEVAYTVNSKDVRIGEQISFRVLIPVMVDGVTVIEKDALVTARVIRAKRGGHWGKAGRLAWTMEDVVAVDNSRVPLAPETALRIDKLWSLEHKGTNQETLKGRGSVKGTSHSGEVAARTIVSGVLFPPLAIIIGFKRGGDAVLHEGRRFVVTVGKDAAVKVRVTP